MSTVQIREACQADLESVLALYAAIEDSPADVLPLPHPQTPASAAARLCAMGLTVAAISRATGINRQTFCALLAGKQQGLRGNAHRAAVLLGLKPAPASRQRGAA